LGQRRQSRELALQVLFQMEFAPNLNFHDGLETFRKNFVADEDVWQYAEFLLAGIQENLPAIDAMIQKSSAHWTLKRMALVDLNIMRVTCFEMKLSSEIIPPAVAINEAIEISRKYGTSDSAAFVNGVLDQLVKE
jgi:N utilization substance protein B